MNGWKLPSDGTCPSFHRAPDGNWGSWGRGQSAEDAAEEAGDRIAHDAGAPQRHRLPDQHVPPINNQNATEHAHIGIDLQM